MDDEALRKEILSRLPEGSAKVHFLRHADVESIEPGEVWIQVVPLAISEDVAGPDATPETICRKVVQEFHQAHFTAIQQLRRDLAAMVGDRAYSFGIRYQKTAGENRSVSESLTLDMRRPAPPLLDDGALRQRILSWFPDRAVLEVQFERHTANPRVEPGELKVGLVPRGPDEYNADPRRAPQDVAAKVVYDFALDHDAAIQRLRSELPSLAAERVRHIAISYGREALGLGVAEPEPTLAERKLTPVMTRLDAFDLETLDTLIAAGFVPSRAEAVRWCLARVRERPAYQQLAQTVKQIDQLKAAF